MKNKLLTLDDLCDYYSSHKNTITYSAEKNNNVPVVVQLEATMTFSEEDYDPEISLLKTHLKSCHIGTNRNHSNIEQSVMEEAKSSIYNRPILGFIHQLSDGSYDFAGHEMFVNDEGELEYEEIPVGCIPESGNAHLVYDKDKDKTYLEVDGIIFEEYTRAAQILKEKKESKVSVELALLDYSYNPKDREMIINRFYFSGITILGKDRYTEKPIEEGMLGSNITLKDFKQNNSMFSNLSTDTNLKLIEALENLNNTLSNFNIKTESKEGGKNENMKFNELLEKYNKTADDITFDVEGLTDEELEAKFAELFEGEDTSNTEPTSDDTNNNDNIDGEANASTDNATLNNAEINSNDQTEIFETIEKSFEVDGKKFSVSFTLSHEDIKYALYNLLSQYEELDNDWYDVRAVYDDYFVFQGWFSNKIFGQKYITNEDNTVALDGERYTLHEELLTDTELAQLNDMRSNYSSIQTELNSYKEADEIADKMTVFEDVAYTNYLDTDEFKALMEKETVKKFSKEELTEKADAALGKLVKATKTFSFKKENSEKKTEEKKHTTFAFASQSKDNSFLDGLLNKNK